MKLAGMKQETVGVHGVRRLIETDTGRGRTLSETPVDILEGGDGKGERECSSGCCCMIGPGGRWRLVLYVAGGAALLGLIVYGFASVA